MQRLLRRRLIRDFKTSISRYIALFGLIILGMYIIVGLVGGAENVITSVEEGQRRNQLEDGMFTTFLPLEQEAVRELEEQGITLEAMFYLEYILANESTLRLYANREQINRLDMSSGRLAETPGEIVLEKQYAASHQLQIGDTITLGTTALTITGIASTPDYDSVLMELSSAAADGMVFGTAFVCREQYDALNEAGLSSKSEEYAYSYLLHDQLTDEELKSYLKELVFDDSAVTDVYFREMVDTYMDQKEELEDGIRALVDGGMELSEGLKELAEHNGDLLDGYTQVFEAYLSAADEQLEPYGLETALTTENYQEELEQLMHQNGFLKPQLSEVLDGLNGLKEYEEAITAYTDGVSTLEEGTGELSRGAAALAGGLEELGAYQEGLNTAAAELGEALAALGSESELPDLIASYTEGVAQSGQGAGALVGGAASLNAGAEELTGYNEALQSGVGSVFQANLAQINDQLTAYGIEETLTAENYREVLERLMGSHGDAIVRANLSEALEGLARLDEYLEALTAYTEAVQQAADGSVELKEGLEELEQEVEELTGELFDYEIANLVQFVKEEDNPRISASIEDEQINKYSGILAGVIVMILFTYVISVFVVNGVEKELPIIGAFYALGVSRQALVRHYLTLPVLITAAGGILGSLLGFSPLGTGYFAQDSIGYFSIPEVQSGYPLYLILYGVIMPPVTAAVVNYLVINRKLKQPVLRLMRKEPDTRSVRQVKIKGLGYIRTFQVRQFLREYRSGLTILAGMFISLLILMLGLNCYTITNNMQIQNKADISYEYMYTYKYPTEEVPEGGMGAYLKSLNKEAYGHNLDVTLLGIEAGNSYFDFAVTPAKNMVTVFHFGRYEVQSEGRRSARSVR